MAFTHEIRAVINETLTAQLLDSNTDRSRTTSKLWPKTFALRMAVATAYSHLGSLQNLSAKSYASFPRMLILIFLPGAVLLDFSMIV